METCTLFDTGTTATNGIAKILTQKLVLSDEMGWLANMADVSEDPSNVVKPEWRSQFYLSGHKLAIHKKVLSQLLFASTNLFCDLLPFVSQLATGNSTIPLDKIKEISDSTKILTLINPHHYTAWNTRKQLILHFPDFNATLSTPPTVENVSRSILIADSCKRELQHIELGLSKQPKSLEAWAHRKWVLHTLSLNQSDVSYQFEASRELKLCNNTAGAHKRNYYTWTHRLYIVQHYQSLILSSSAQGELYSCFLKSELRNTWAWLQKHYSDASAAHHICALLTRLGITSMSDLFAVSPEEGLLSLIKPLMDDSKKYITLYNAGETWWYVRRFSLSKLIMECVESMQSQKYIDEIQKAIEAEILVLQDVDVQKRLKSLHLVWIIRFFQDQCHVRSTSLSTELIKAKQDAEEFLAVDGWIPMLN